MNLHSRLAADSLAEGARKQLRIAHYFTSGIDLTRFTEVSKAAGVEAIHVSIISGRCGSTMLAHILDKSTFGHGREPFNEWNKDRLAAFAGPQQFDLFLDKVMRSYVVNGRFYFQIDPIRLDSISHLLPGEAPFPNVQAYTLIFRRNIVAQALSYFHATSSGIWHSNHAKGEASADAAFAPNRLIPWIRHIHNMEVRATEMHRRQADVYYYEDIVAAPFETAALFIERGGSKISPSLLSAAVHDECGPKKLFRHEYGGRYMAVMNEFPWLAEVLAQRNAGLVPTPALSKHIQHRPGAD